MLIVIGILLVRSARCWNALPLVSAVIVTALGAAITFKGLAG